MPYFGEMGKRISLNEKVFFFSSDLLGYSLALFKIMRITLFVILGGDTQYITRFPTSMF